jgi:hydroxymethylglutaryl-CoA reductase
MMQRALDAFRHQTPAERRAALATDGWLTAAEAIALETRSGLDDAQADVMIENVVGVFGLPLAVALNFRLNGEERLVPMAVEEPSIVAAASYGARMAAAGGGFRAVADPPLLAAQVQLLDVADPVGARTRIEGERATLLAVADASLPALRARGGGARDLEVRLLAAGMLCVHVYVDCRDAMGANLVNTVAEAIAPRLAAVADGRIGLRILSNLADRRTVSVRASVPTEALASATSPDGAAVREGILEAQRFADVDPYRATTHNKGIMNGVDALLVACGNDWRAVEAGAHAYAARSGRYRPLSRWWPGAAGRTLEGELIMPLAASTVGGAARTHPGVTLALRLARAVSGTDLAMLAGAAGLASNLAALRALSTEGIQRGHMRQQARRVAAEAGAVGETVDVVAQRLAEERVYRPERAREILSALAGEP